MDLHARLRNAVPWLAFSKTVVQAISLLSTLTVARLLNPNDYGVMALSAFWTSSLTMVSELGAGAAVIQFRDLEKRELNALFAFTMGLSLLGYAALFGSAPAIASWFHNEQLVSVLRVAGLALPLSTLRIVPESLLRKELRFEVLAKTNIAASALAIPVALSCALLGAGVWALVAAALVSAVMQTGVIIATSRWVPSFALGSARLPHLLRFSFHALGGRLCWTVYQQLDVVVLGKFGGTATVGVYSMAMQLIVFPIEKVFNIVNEIAYPAMAHLQDNLDELRRSFLKSLQLVALLACPLYIGLAFVAHDLVRVILTDKWASSADLLLLLVPYGLLSSLAVLPAPLLLARYRSDVVFRYTLIQLFIMPPAFWIGARSFGASGVAMAWVIMYPLALAWLLSQVKRETQMAWRDLWIAVMPAAGAAAFMGAALLALRAAINMMDMESSLTTLLLAVGLGLVTYPLGLWVCARQTWREILSIAQRTILEHRRPADTLPVSG